MTAYDYLFLGIVLGIGIIAAACVFVAIEGMEE